MLSNRKVASRRVVKCRAQREALAAFDPAHAMAQIDAISPARPLHRPLAHREDDAVALRKRRDLRARLHARPLLGQYELAAGEVMARLGEQDRELQRKEMLAVHVLMQAIVVAGAVAQQKRRRPFLTRLMAARQEGFVFRGIANG